MLRNTSTLSDPRSSGFGSFTFMCKEMSSYPFCNLFFHQLSKTSFVLPDSRTASIGVNPDCGIPRAVNGRFGNVANMVTCGIAMILLIYIIQRATRRKAAVGRIEIRAMLAIYLITLPLQFITNGGLLEQGSTLLVILTAVHAGAVVTFFWALLANAIVATQVVEDGTASSLIPFYGLSGIFFIISTYIAADTGFGFTTVFRSAPPERLNNIGLFIILNIWPVVAAILYLGIMSFIVVRVLKEMKPLAYYYGAFLLFAASQAVYFLASKPLCKASGQLLDSSFLATILETAAVGTVFLGWMSITEASWEEQYFMA